jgi:hypothetical protein
MLGDKGSVWRAPDPTSLSFQTPILYRKVFKTLEAGLHIPYVDEVHMLELSVPHTKNLGGEGPYTDKHLPQSPFTGKFI